MENEKKTNNNDNNEVDTTALHNLMFFIIIVLLCLILFVNVKTYAQISNSINMEKIQYYNTHLQK
jgi:hypothetical protein